MEVGLALCPLGVVMRLLKGRNRTEEALRYSEENLRLAVEATDLGMWDYDVATGKLIWNQRLKELYGLAPQAEVDFESYVAGVHPEDRDRILGIYREALGSEGSGRFGFEHRTVGRNDGKIRWVQAAGRILFNEQRRPRRVIGTVLDVTERKMMEDAMRRLNETLEQRVEQRTRQLAAANERLRQNEESYRALFGKAPLPLFSLDAKGNISDVNEHWLELTGYTREEVIERSIMDFLPARRDDLYETYLETLKRKGILHNAEYQFVQKSGAVIDTLLSARIEVDGEGAFVRTIVASIDISPRKRAEEALRREQRFSELLIESSPGGVVAIDRELRYTLWNGTQEKITGWRAGDVLGRSVLEAFPRCAGTAIERAWRAALEGHTTSFQDQPYRLRRSGVSGFYDATFAPLYGADRAILGGICFVREVSERHRVEEGLRQTQKMEAVGQLTGGLAHDFNNLLTVIIGNLDLIEAALPGEARLQRLVQGIRHAAVRGARLTEHLLTFARRQTLRPEVVDINTVITETSNLLRQATGDAVEISYKLCPAPWPCRIDTAQFESAILNLAVNARDAMGGRGRVTIESANVTLGEGGDAEAPLGDCVMVAVSDTGIGMAPDIIARAFDPFFTTKGVGKGSGLGLSMVYGFVRQSGGKVDIESAVGQGTTIRIYLPRTEAADVAASENAPLPLTDRRQGSGTILLVEDDDDVRHVASSALGEFGYNVLVAASGNEALGILESRAHIDLLCSDVVMPGISGIELAREAQQMRPGIAVLLTSGYSPETVAGHGSIDSFAFLSKPYRPAELADQVHRLMEHAVRP